MRKFLKRVLGFSKQARAVGIRNFISFHTRSRNTPIKVQIAGYDIVTRARTSDLSVALESLTSEYAFLDDLLPSDFGGLIVDAGGYIGTAAVAFASRFPKATVLSIEPSSENLAILRQNIAVYPNADVRHAALGAVAGAEIELHNRSTGAWGFTIIENPNDVDTVSKLETVPADFLGRANRRP